MNGKIIAQSIESPVPAGWKKYKISSIATVYNGYPFNSEKFSTDRGFPIVRIRDIANSVTSVRYDGSWVDSAAIDDGDTLVGMDGDFNVCQWRGGRALLNQRVCVVRSKKGFSNGFLRYYLPLPLKIINDLTYSTTVKHLSSSDIEKLYFFAPEDPERQEQIVNYLDRKTTLISKMIHAKNKTYMQLLELRTAIITEIIFDKAAFNKNSLDQLYRHLLSLESGTWGDEPNGINEIRCLRVADFDYDHLSHIAPQTMRSITPLHFKSKLLRCGDILIEKSGGGEKTPVGRAILVGKMPEPTTYANFIDRLRFRNTVLPEFALYLLYAMYAGKINTKYIKQNTGIQNLDIKHYLKEPVPIPSVSEQYRIVELAKHKLSRIDAASKKLRISINQLEEYRTSLVSNVITGKVEV